MAACTNLARSAASSLRPTTATPSSAGSSASPRRPRRGGLCGLRWTDFDPAAGEVVLRRAIVQGEDGVEVKKTKTDRDRRLAVDPTTVAALNRHHEMVQRRAEECGGRLAGGAYIFSRDVEGLEP